MFICCMLLILIICLRCDFMNFAKNTVCLQCDAKRPKRQLLPGEWECPQYVSTFLFPYAAWSSLVWFSCCQYHIWEEIQTYELVSTKLENIFYMLKAFVVLDEWSSNVSVKVRHDHLEIFTYFSSLILSCPVYQICPYGMLGGLNNFWWCLSTKRR